MLEPLSLVYTIFDHPNYLVLICIILLTFANRFNRILEEMDISELNNRLDEFEPSPLIENPAEEDEKLDRMVPSSTYINLLVKDFLSLGKSPVIRQNVANIIGQYGVGTCGPRGFFGTTDKHLFLERKIAEFYNKDIALVYSYGALVISSVIGCCVAVGDIVFIDEFANDQILYGVRATKGTIHRFKHNDSNDLSIILNRNVTHNKLIKQNSKFLILESIYNKDGMICDLPSFIKVAKKFSLRIILDESLSVGVLGATGHGIIEYYKGNMEEVDVICGAFEHAFGTIGGFSTGSVAAVGCQHLVSLSFVYSASLSVFLLESIIEGLDSIDDRAVALRETSRETQDLLERFEQFNVFSHSDSPLKVFAPRIDHRNSLYSVQEKLVKYCKDKLNVLMGQDERGIYFYLNYDVFNNQLEKEKVFSAIEVMAELVSKFHTEILEFHNL